MSAKLPWWKRYYASDSASLLFRPILLLRTKGAGYDYVVRRRAFEKYAIDKGKVRLLQGAFYLVSVLLGTVVVGIIWLLQKLTVPPVKAGMITALLVGLLAVIITFTLPVVFEQYGTKKGWLKKTSRPKHRYR